MYVTNGLWTLEALKTFASSFQQILRKMLIFYWENLKIVMV